MILGIGTDMTVISRMEKALARHGDRLLLRCFADEERHKAESPAHYAKRWAAKEACAKALGLGVRQGITMKDMVVTNDAHGRPHIVLKDGAEARLAHITPHGLSARLHVSLSDEAGMALAFVIISAT